MQKPLDQYQALWVFLDISIHDVFSLRPASAFPAVFNSTAHHFLRSYNSSPPPICKITNQFALIVCIYKYQLVVNWSVYISDNV
jgi:hypothetical protein